MKILIILSLLSLSAQASYLKRCEVINNEEKCEIITNNDNFKQLSLNDVKLNSCYLKHEGLKKVFFKVTKLSGTAINAQAEVLVNENWDNEIIIDQFFWEGENFNYKLKEISCDLTPHLGDEPFLSKMCGVDKFSRGVRFCKQPIIRPGFERKL